MCNAAHPRSGHSVEPHAATANALAVSSRTLAGPRRKPAATGDAIALRSGRGSSRPKRRTHGTLDARPPLRHGSLHDRRLGAGRRGAFRAPARHPGLSGRRVPGRPGRAEARHVAGDHRDDLGARPDLPALHDRARDRPEEGRALGQGHPGAAPACQIVGGAALGVLFFLALGLPLGGGALGRALSRARGRALLDRHHRQGALRQARARHAAGPDHARHPRPAGPVRDPVPGRPAEPQRPAHQRRCCCRSCGSAALVATMLLVSRYVLPHLFRSHRARCPNWCSSARSPGASSAANSPSSCTCRARWARSSPACRSRPSRTRSTSRPR